MKRVLFFLFIQLFTIILVAQNIVVESFVHLETDLTANLEGTIVYDQNGEKCALIKIRSNPPTKDFIFDLGVLGVVETRFDGPDIWLYVPYGVKKITIKHPQLGVLEDYDLGIPVKKANTYMLSLRVGRVQTIIEEQLMKQFLMFRLNPKDAVVEVAGETWIPNADGVCRKMLSYGTYDYRVKAKNCRDEVGKVTLSNAEETKVVEINLRPEYGCWIEVRGGDDLVGAVVYVDDEMVGRVPVKTEKLSSGRHNVRIVKDLFLTYIEDVIVEDNQTKVLSPKLVGDFSSVAISTKSGAEIWVDGELKGITAWNGRLSFGEHFMETKQTSHRSQSRVIYIQPNEVTKSIQLPEPLPIYGNLSVEVLPDFADIYIDGINVGQTPKIIPKILIGEHKVQVYAEGKRSMEKIITIRENEMLSVTGELQDDGKEIGQSISSNDDLVFNINGVQFTMKRVEGGIFMMGATPEQDRVASDDEKPVHSVKLDTYYIGETEVTQALWFAVMGSNPSHYEGDDLPVEQVSWDDCQEFIKRLNQFTGQTFSLPTEAQWEFAARGGNLSKGYKYAGGDVLSDVAWWDANSNYQTYKVAQKIPNELGIYDMSGNVLEWCSDWYGNYSLLYQTNPVGPSSGAYRVIRGGSWNSKPLSCRVSNRWNDSNTPHSDLGLRLVLISNVYN